VDSQFFKPALNRTFSTSMGIGDALSTSRTLSFAELCAAIIIPTVVSRVVSPLT
jgi:hypothetical protein